LCGKVGMGRGLWRFPGMAVCEGRWRGGLGKTYFFGAAGLDFLIAPWAIVDAGF
jgi:hypothetical protein